MLNSNEDSYRIRGIYSICCNYGNAASRLSGLGSSREWSKSAVVTLSEEVHADHISVKILDNGYDSNRCKPVISSRFKPLEHTVGIPHNRRLCTHAHHSSVEQYINSCW